MPLPSPAVVTLISTDEDTGDAMPGLTMFSPTVEDNGSQITWHPEEDRAKTYSYANKKDMGDYLSYSTDNGELRVRALDPYDGVSLAPRAGVPQPLEVLQAEVLRGGGVVAQELSAVVAPDNTVVTLMLETGLGIYVRYSGDWQLLSSDSEALDGYYIIPVSPEAVAVFDQADMADATLSAFDLPRTETFDNGNSVNILPDAVGTDPVNPDLTAAQPVTAGAYIPPVDTVDDLDVAIRLASVNPDARWFVAKRAKALGAAERVPADWYPHAVVHPF